MTTEGRGFLRIRVTEVNGSLPVENAIVNVSDYSEDGEGEILYTLRTDSGGLTPTISLPAPAASASMKPGSVQPYALYNASVTSEGYYTVENVGIMIFDNVVAIQPVNLAPLSEEESIAGAENGSVVIIENTNRPERGDLEADGGMR